MLIRRATDIRSSEITDEKLYLNRRRFIQAASSGALVFSSLASNTQAEDWKPKSKSPYDTDEDLTPYEDVTTYNNFQEFGPDKDDPSKNAHTLRVKPWSVKVEGEVKRPATYNLEDLVKPLQLEDRIYRLRCVEAWSMVIPWLGFPLGELIKRLEPSSKAKYVEFTTLHAPDQMPGQRRSLLPWPYVEGL
ncbi:MAG: protein-methionine-sulfoxide reductase catalytic subunit MsrP, partial [Acidobacteria bacterium]